MSEGAAERLTLDTVFDYFKANGYRGLLELPEREVTQEVYDYFLGILPPVYVPHGFQMCELVTEGVASQYTRRNGKYFHRYAAPAGGA